VLDVTAKPRRFKLLRGLRDKVLRFWSRLLSRRPRVSARGPEQNAAERAAGAARVASCFEMLLLVMMAWQA